MLALIDASLRQKLTAILAATRQHAQNLGCFVATYKIIRCILKRTNSGKEGPLDPFLSGLLAGYMVFRENNNINQQITLYIFSRVVLGMFRVLVNTGYDNNESILADFASPQTKALTWPLFASGCWATVMYLHERHHHVLPLSMANSMSYLYQQSNQWDSLSKSSTGHHFISKTDEHTGTLVWHNT